MYPISYGTSYGNLMILRQWRLSKAHNYFINKQTLMAIAVDALIPPTTG